MGVLAEIDLSEGRLECKVLDMEVESSGERGVELIQGADIPVEFSDMDSEVFDTEVRFSGN